jgi:hypothetical protein
MKATGKSITEHFGRPEFGWDFEVVRLLVAVLVRAGAIQMTHKSETIESTTSVAAKDALTNNNYFRLASFQPKKGVNFAEIAKAADNFKSTFGAAVKELSLSPVVAEIRAALHASQDDLQRARDQLVFHRLPGSAVLDDALAQARTIDRGSEDSAIAEFNASYQKVKDAIRRAAEIENELTPSAVVSIEAARQALGNQWRALDAELDLAPAVREAAAHITDVLERETFFRDLADVNQWTFDIKAEYDRRFREALAEKVALYHGALDQLCDEPGWPGLDVSAKEDIAAALRYHAEDDGLSEPALSQVRSDSDACLARLRAAIEKVHHVIEGDRIVTVDIQPYFRGGVEDSDQLDAALSGVREECERLIADGKKIVIR